MGYSRIHDWFWMGPIAPLRAERDPAFREEVRRLNVIGMRLAGSLAVLGPLFNIMANLALMGKTPVLWGAEPENSLAIAGDSVIILFGIIILAASFFAFGSRFGRTIGSVSAGIMFLATMAEHISSGVSQASPIGDGMIFIILMLVVSGCMPMRLWHTFSFGSALIVVYFICILNLPEVFGVAAIDHSGQALVFMTMITLFSSGISAHIYNSHYRLWLSRKEEESLRRETAISEDKYRSLFEDSTDAIFAIDNNSSKFIEVNHAFEELLNRTAEELYDLNFLEVIAPEDRDMVADNRRRRAEGEDIPWRYPLKVIRKGAPEPIICDLTVHKVGDSRTSMGALRDITDVVKAKERVERLAHIPEENPNPVIRCDYEGKITYMNPSAKNLTVKLGVPDSSIEELLPGDFVQEVQRSIDTGETIMFHLHRTQEHTFSITYNPHPDAREVYVWMMDMTETVNAFDKIRSYAEELESKNREIEETRIQLVQSEKMAALGNLVAGVAHEINTPLGAINSNVDISERALKSINELIHAGNCSMTDEVRAKADKTMAILRDITVTMHVAVERIVEIVRSLRNFARLDEAERKPADLHEGINSTLTLLAYEFKNRITVEKDYGDLPLVDCFPNQLNQVFMNILVNASQAIDSKGTVTIRTSVDKSAVKLQFIDNGTGIKKSDLRRIYDPGFTTKGVGVGTGLGLSIVYRIIQQHNGAIDIRSALGEGTTVTVTIPVAG
ncbi:MAG: PAS domain S-box protein [candidate division Zixibacteria bacterium]|nr:PAS domain S-box protein [candidate division Zixibacteria bacterium]